MSLASKKLPERIDHLGTYPVDVAIATEEQIFTIAGNKRAKLVLVGIDGSAHIFSFLPLPFIIPETDV